MTFAGLLFIAGAAMLTAGVWLMFAPAGLIVAGAALMLVAWLYVRGGLVA